ncbi:MAG: hypothetical protein Q8L73_03015 [Methylotenera sp.]|nr:hypothetical protein [Methylotenera sp.]
MVKHSHQRGFAYLAVLFLVAAISVSMAVVAQNEDTLVKREKEQDWLFIGKQYQRAIASYYHQSPDGIKTLPTKIDALILDKRFIAPMRHLRKVYGDPLNNQQDWGLIKNQEDQITGVYSQSQEPILSTRIISEYLENLGDQAENYANIKFVFKPEETNNEAVDTKIEDVLTEE